MCFGQRSWLADEIVQFAVHGRELVRDSIGNDDHLAFGDLMFLAAFILVAGSLVRAVFLCFDRFATFDQLAGSFNHIDHSGAELVVLSLPGSTSPAGVPLMPGGS